MQDTTAAFGFVPRTEPLGLYGFDASIYVQEIDWSKVQSEGHFNFAFIECASGMTKGPAFKTIWDDATRAIPCGPYQRLTSGTAQARQFLDVIATTSGLKSTDLPPVLDVEPENDGVVRSQDLYVCMIDQWVSAVEAEMRRKPILYTSASFWNQIGSPSKYADLCLWVANYAVPYPAVPNPWDGYHFWQYAPDALRDSLGCYAVDLDFFGGDNVQLQSFIRNSILS